MKIHTKGKHDCMIMIIIKYISTKYPVGGWGWRKEGVLVVFVSCKYHEILVQGFTINI